MRDSTRIQLEAELAILQTTIGQLRAEGDYFLEAWVGGSIPKGKTKAYPRVQSRLKQFGGKRVRHIRKDESIAYFQACCDRGQRIGKLQKAIGRIEGRLSPET